VTLTEIWPKIEEFVLERYDESGGFKMSPVDYPNSTATYCALSILANIGVEFENKSRCAQWLTSQKIDSVYSLYTFIKSLQILEKNKQAKEIVSKNLDLVKKSMTFPKKRRVYEFEQEFKKINFVSELSVIDPIEFDLKVIKEIVNHQNVDGGFGWIGHSTITSTYHALGTLKCLNRMEMINKKGSLDYIRKCERPGGGFVTRPENILPYMEYTYYGVKSLEMLIEEVKFVIENIKFVLNCINKDGGFRRTPILGISSIENVFYATSILKSLNVEKSFTKKLEKFQT
jgi:hypothetical protein